MERGTQTKLKLMVIYEYLMKYSDETSPVTTKELCEHLAAQGIACHRTALPEDIADLNAGGYEVMSVRSGHSNAYYILERLFSIGELKILMDLVQAAEFISPERTEELRKKLASLAGPLGELLLAEGSVWVRPNKHRTKSLYANVELLEQAVRQQNQVSFVCFDSDEHREKKYAHRRKRYLVKPIGLCCSENRYYLLTWNTEEQEVRHFRVDRLEAIRLEAPFDDSGAAEARAHAADYLGGSFQMFGGRQETVVLEFPRELIRYIYDRFGEGTKITKLDSGSFRATVKVQVSPTFFGWIFQFAGRMKLAGPGRVKQQYLEHAQKAWAGMKD